MRLTCPECQPGKLELVQIVRGANGIRESYICDHCGNLESTWSPLGRENTPNAETRDVESSDGHTYQCKECGKGVIVREVTCGDCTTRSAGAGRRPAPGDTPR